MGSGILGLGAVAWTEAWNAAAPEPGLHLSVDPARLLELLRGLPVARALLGDLQRAASAGRSVELIVSPDHQVAEIATGSGHYVLTTAARNSVLAALIGRPQADPARGPQAEHAGAASPRQEALVPSRTAPAPGILWESPSAVHQQAPPESIALPWLGPAAYLEVRRDGSRPGAGADQEPAVSCATLHLELPGLGRFDARIRACGSTVAVSVAASAEDHVRPRLAELERQLSARGLVAAHVGLEPLRG